jgi:hypothetical protein
MGIAARSRQPAHSRRYAADGVLAGDIRSPARHLGGLLRIEPEIDHSGQHLQIARVAWCPYEWYMDIESERAI